MPKTCSNCGGTAGFDEYLLHKAADNMPSEAPGKIYRCIDAHCNMTFTQEEFDALPGAYHE